MPKPPADGYVDAGVRLHYLDWGGDGAPVLLLHGGGLDAHAWDPVCERLAGTYRCVALDQRGHGASAWSPDGVYSLARHVRDIAAVVAALRLDACAVVGHSMGGMNALGYAILRRPKLRALAIVDTAPLRMDTQAADRLLAAGQARRPPGATYDPAHMAGDTIRAQRAEATDLEPQLHAVGCRALVVHGAASRIIKREDAERFAASLPSGEFVVIDGAGHNVQRDRPAELAEALHDFLATASAPA